MNAPPMLTLTGTVVHVFDTPGGANKETGETYNGGPRVQLLAEIPLRNGDTRMDLVTLSTDAPEEYRRLTGSWVRVPIGAYASGGKVGFYALRGQKPQPLDEAA